MKAESWRRGLRTAANIKTANRAPLLKTITVPRQVSQGRGDPLLNIAGRENTAVRAFSRQPEPPAPPVLADLIGCLARRVDEAYDYSAAMVRGWPPPIVAPTSRAFRRDMTFSAKVVMEVLANSWGMPPKLKPLMKPAQLVIC